MKIRYNYQPRFKFYGNQDDAGSILNDFLIESSLRIDSNPYFNTFDFNLSTLITKFISTFIFILITKLYFLISNLYIFFKKFNFSLYNEIKSH